MGKPESRHMSRLMSRHMDKPILSLVKSLQAYAKARHMERQQSLKSLAGMMLAAKNDMQLDDDTFSMILSDIIASYVENEIDERILPQIYNALRE